MWRPLGARPSLHEPLDQDFQHRQIFIPISRWGHERLLRAFDLPLGPGQEVDDKVFDEREPPRPTPRRDRSVSERMSHLIAEVSQHLRRSHLAPSSFGIGAKCMKPMLDVSPIGWIEDGTRVHLPERSVSSQTRLQVVRRASLVD